MELPVSGPFHSTLMKTAAEGLKLEMEKVTFRSPGVAYYSDIDAVEITDPSMIKDSLVRQLTAPVQWDRVVEAMIRGGLEVFVEVGPGKVLTGLIRKISKDIPLQNAGDVASIKALVG